MSRLFFATPLLLAACNSASGFTDGGAGTETDGGGAAGSKPPVNGSAGAATGPAGTAGTDPRGSAGSTSAAGEGGMLSAPVVDGGDAGSNDSGADCDKSASPLYDACVIEDGLAIFVSPTGKKDADGTMNDPISLGGAVAKANVRGLARILLCTGSYGERLVIDDVDSVIEVYGGFDCSKAQWEATSSGGTTVEPSSGVALRVTDMIGDVRIENVAFEAVDATEDGASSIAAILDGNTYLLLKDVQLTAGRGEDGANASNTEPFEFPMTGACSNDDECLEANDAVDTEGGEERAFSECPGGGLTVGGRGGDGDADPDDGNDGSPDNGLGAGGAAQAGVNPCRGGQLGGAGDDGSDGSSSWQRGTIESSRAWIPTTGGSGQHGQVGQGGGGGGATETGGGGGGGAGGCGGKGGAGGQGGGGSIALLSIANESVVLTDCILTTHNGGDGGDGAAGQEGMSTGGIGGSGDNGACPGGKGGAGGAGGPGAGGVGGISVGIVFKGNQPTRNNTPVNHGSAGDGGAGAGTSNDGNPGIAQSTLLVN